MAKMVRVTVEFTADEVKIIEQAVERANQKPGSRSRRSDIVRQGTLQYAASILSSNEVVGK